MVKLESNIKKLLTNGKCIILAYDHGMEHGPKDFSGENENPEFIMDIVKKAKLSAVIFQKGIAEKYYEKKSSIPLIIKLNGKTNLSKGEPISRQMCSVSEAIALGASAVGYTIYLGSENESIMLEEFGKIEEEAHKLGIPVIAWMYPRGKAVKEVTPETIEYAARAALEIGADFVKLKYTGDIESFKKVVKAAGKCRVLALGGEKSSDKEVENEAREIIKAGASGLAIGRNIWQNPKPIEFALKLRKIITGK